MNGVEYKWDNVEERPYLHGITVEIEKNINVKMDDISYHPEEKWLKIWFESDLGDEYETVNAIVFQNFGKADIEIEAGSEYFELVPYSKKRWKQHIRRISFRRVFGNVPKVTVNKHSLDKAIDLKIKNVTSKHFDFVVKSKSSYGFASVAFEWEAEYEPNK